MNGFVEFQHSDDSCEQLLAIVLNFRFNTHMNLIHCLQKIVPPEVEESEEFIQAKRKHSAVESLINALENHGLDRCLDHGISVSSDMLQ